MLLQLPKPKYAKVLLPGDRSWKISLLQLETIFTITSSVATLSLRNMSIISSYCSFKKNISPTIKYLQPMIILIAALFQVCSFLFGVCTFQSTINTVSIKIVWQRPFLSESALCPAFVSSEPKTSSTNSLSCG